jgi:hypothetical protein
LTSAISLISFFASSSSSLAEPKLIAFIIGNLSHEINHSLTSQYPFSLISLWPHFRFHYIQLHPYTLSSANSRGNSIGRGPGQYDSRTRQHSSRTGSGPTRRCNLTIILIKIQHFEFISSIIAFFSSLNSANVSMMIPKIILRNITVIMLKNDTS